MSLYEWKGTVFTEGELCRAPDESASGVKCRLRRCIELQA